jgi:glyoxylase-like metal-dependent hydrolase (beta-lactamase superfamily II)
MWSQNLGSTKLTLVDDGLFRLDGGAVFSVVPRVLWERKKPPDEKNRIAMASNCLLVERGSDLVLVDVGLGDKLDAKGRGLFGLEEGARRLPEAIREAGYELGDVTAVVPTHLHFDHCGWNTQDDGSGHYVPTFPNARYFLQRDEVEHARAPNVRDASSYDPRNWEPLFEAGVVELMDGDFSPVPGLQAVPVPGHNRDMCIVLIDEGDERAVFWADLIPTTAHVATAWVMSYDLYPLETMANKEKWLPQAAAGGWLSFFGHEAEQPVGRIVLGQPGRYRFEAEAGRSDRPNDP